MMLLTDGVFSQNRNFMKRLIEFVTTEPGFQIFISRNVPNRWRGVKLTTNDGRDILFNKCREKLEKSIDAAANHILREVMSENVSRNNLKEYWKDRFNDSTVIEDNLREAIDFGIIDEFTSKEIENLVGKDPKLHLRWLMVTGYFEEIEKNPVLFKMVSKTIFGGKMNYYHRRNSSDESLTMLEIVNLLLHPFLFIELIFEHENSTEYYESRQIPSLQELYFEYTTQNVEKVIEMSKNHPFLSFTKELLELLTSSTPECWQQSLQPWSNLVDLGFDLFPENFLMVHLAIISTAIASKDKSGKWDSRGFLPTKGLVSRLNFASRKTDTVEWWSKALSKINGETTISTVSILLTYGKEKLIESLLYDIDKIVSELKEEDWSFLLFAIRMLTNSKNSRINSIPECWFKNIKSISSKTILLLVCRVDDLQNECRMFRDYFYNMSCSDKRVLQHAARLESISVEKRSDVSWQYLLKLSTQARSSDIRNLFILSEPLTLDIPLNISKQVLLDCNIHCEQMITLCEQAFTVHVASSATKVVQIAENEGWFEQNVTINGKVLYHL